MSALYRLIGDRRAATAAEFAMVLPLLILLLFGIIDAGRFMWEYNRAEKATQAGARMAVVTDVVAGGLATTSYVGVGGLTQGDVIPASALSPISCSQTACSPATGTVNTAAFDRIVTRMQAMKPDIAAANVRVEYRGSGLGYAGDPNGMEISPLVTVRLTGLQFRPVTSLLFAVITMPDTLTTLTAEDSAGIQSN